MRETFRCISKLALGDTAFVVMVVVTILFALVFQLIVAPSPELTAELIALFVSTAALEWGENSAARCKNNLQRVRSRSNTRL